LKKGSPKKGLSFSVKNSRVKMTRKMGITRREFMKLAALGGLSLLVPGSETESLHLPSLPEKPIKQEQAVIFVMPDIIEGDFKTWGRTLSETTYFEDVVGHRVQGLSFFADLDKKPPEPRVIENALSSGRAVMFNLMPRITGNMFLSRESFSYSSFAEGKHFNKLQEMARMMKAFGEPIFVRYGFEMNGDWFSWGGNPNEFQEIWKYTVSVFRIEGASNVKWIFSPNYLPSPEKISEYFPGDEWVDLIGPDVYDWEEKDAAFALNRINYYLRQVSRKPLITGEIGAAGENQDEWVSRAIYKSLAQGASAINYFQYNKEKMWKLKKDNVPMTRSIAESGVFLREDAGLNDIHKTILSVND
jgi:hypothetical protein